MLHDVDKANVSYANESRREIIFDAILGSYATWTNAMLRTRNWMVLDQFNLDRFPPVTITGILHMLTNPTEIIFGVVFGSLYNRYVLFIIYVIHRE